MLSTRFIRTAVVLFVIGVFFGFAMGLARNFSLQSVHVHVNLLGWVSMCLIGLLYSAHPQLQRGWVPYLQYWLHTLGLLIFMGALVLAKTLQMPGLVPVMVVGAVMLCLGALLLAAHVFTRLRVLGQA